MSANAEPDLRIVRNKKFDCSAVFVGLFSSSFPLFSLHSSMFLHFYTLSINYQTSQEYNLQQSQRTE